MKHLSAIVAACGLSLIALAGCGPHRKADAPPPPHMTKVLWSKVKDGEPRGVVERALPPSIVHTDKDACSTVYEALDGSSYVLTYNGHGSDCGNYDPNPEDTVHAMNFYPRTPQAAPKPPPPVMMTPALWAKLRIGEPREAVEAALPDKIVEHSAICTTAFPAPHRIYTIIWTPDDQCAKASDIQSSDPIVAKRVYGR